MFWIERAGERDQQLYKRLVGQLGETILIKDGLIEQEKILRDQLEQLRLKVTEPTRQTPKAEAVKTSSGDEDVGNPKD